MWAISFYYEIPGVFFSTSEEINSWTIYSNILVHLKKYIFAADSVRNDLVKLEAVKQHNCSLSQRHQS